MRQKMCTEDCERVAMWENALTWAVHLYLHCDKPLNEELNRLFRHHHSPLTIAAVLEKTVNSKLKEVDFLSVVENFYVRMKIEQIIAKKH